MIDKKIIKNQIKDAIDKILVKGLGKRANGKVRDWFVKDNLRILISTDRISAFDKVLGLVPNRGAVLNKLSEFWFEATRDIVQNHMIGTIDPNVMLVSQCATIPVEVVVRGYITGVTDTSLWKQYSDGKRTIYGIKFPDNLKKNQKLKKFVITPTTRATGPNGHDEPITKAEIISKKLVTVTNWAKIEKIALSLFQRGTDIYSKKGFILADTKYEFGLDHRGKIILIDEVHTPDSSRIWQKASYAKRFKNGEEMENFDKETMRLWFVSQGYHGRGKAPKMPEDLVVELSQKYQEVYEKVTGVKFTTDPTIKPKERIVQNLVKLT